MALIEADNPAAAGTMLEYWQDQLTNTRVIIFELDKIILGLERQEKESYTFNSGQTSITVRRVNLPELIERRGLLMRQAQDIETVIDNLQNRGSNFVQVRPY